MTRIVRYGSSAPVTRWSRSGSISSRAVARRITPLRCNTPSPSTYPFGRVKANSVCRPAIVTSHPVEELLLDGQLFDHHLVAAGLEVGRGELRRPALFHVE